MKVGVLFLILFDLLAPYFRNAEKEMIKDIETDYFVEASYEGVYEIIEAKGYRLFFATNPMAKKCRDDICMLMLPDVKNKEIAFYFANDVHGIEIISDDDRRKLIGALIKKYGDYTFTEENAGYSPKNHLEFIAYTKVIAPTWELTDKRIKVIECVPEDAEYPYFRIEVTYK